jgi:hypothetical protein
MAFVEKYLRRSVAILKMPEAIARGLSATKFLQGLKITSGGYQKQRFLADWRSVAGIGKRKDAFKFVRRDRRPPISAIADVEWELEREYMYKVRVFVRTTPDEPMEERFVNIPSDRPLSPEEQEAEVERLWDDEWKYEGETLERAQAVAGYHRVESPDMED